MSEQEIEQMAKYAKEYYPEVLVILAEAAQSLQDCIATIEYAESNGIPILFETEFTFDNATD